MLISILRVFHQSERRISLDLQIAISHFDAGWCNECISFVLAGYLYVF